MNQAATFRPCAAEGCALESAPGRRYCYPHKYEAEKQRDPVRVAWHRLTSSAKARGIFCDLSVEDFREFCIETEILLGRGRSALSYHVDRIIEELGYTRGNLQKLTNRDNVLKEHARRKRKIYDYELAARRRLGAYSCEAEALEDAGVSEFRFVPDNPTSPQPNPDDDVDLPF